MMGKTHLTVGLWAGVLLAIYGFLVRNYLLPVMALTAPMGAMLPDIDHNSTKLGRKRKVVVGTTRKIIIAAAVGVAGYILYKSFTTPNGLNTMAKELIIIGCVLLLMLVARSQGFKKKFKFFAKHRGIMHTLLVPALLVYGSVLIKDATLRYLVQGFAIGYLTHLAGDCLTHDGCPILWPLTTADIHFLNVKTNTKGEKFAALVECVCLAVVLRVAVNFM